MCYQVVQFICMSVGEILSEVSTIKVTAHYFQQIVKIFIRPLTIHADK